MRTGKLAPTRIALDDPRWGSFIAGCADSTPFHDPGWAELLALTYGYEAFAVALSDDGGRLLAGAPFLEVRSLARRRRWISLPFTDECPLLKSDQVSAEGLPVAFALALEELGAPAAEVRGGMDGVGWRTGADAVIHELELMPDVDQVRKRFSRSQVIRNIARAEREGVIVRRASNAHDLDAFYALHTRTRRRQGVPVQPRRFFDLLWSRLVASDRAFILLADAGGREAVAGALFLASLGSTIYKFGASDVDSWPLRPNHLIFWTAIQEACARGDRRFDFGRTDVGNGGLRAFKSGWGAAERPLKYSTFLPGAAAGSEGFASRALSLAIRRGPKWVCRGTGEALYRYAASR
jgi:CelD/BcsL family acetyltransferase involved in cellulose biosynthesis